MTSIRSGSFLVENSQCHFFFATKKAGLLEAKKWVNIVTREDIDHLIFVLSLCFHSLLGVGSNPEKGETLDPQNDGTFTNKIWHIQSTKNFGLDIFPIPIWPPKRSNTQRGFPCCEWWAKSGGAPRYQFPNGQQTHVYIQYTYVYVYVYI